MKKEIIWVIFIIAGTVTIGAIALNTPDFLPFTQLLAQVGITVGIAPNPYNTLDAQLNAKQQQLDQQQADLAAQQAALASSTAQTQDQTAPYLWYLLSAVALLGLLVGLNFYFDWNRARKEKEKEKAASGGDATINR